MVGLNSLMAQLPLTFCFWCWNLTHFISKTPYTGLREQKKKKSMSSHQGGRLGPAEILHHHELISPCPMARCILLELVGTLSQLRGAVRREQSFRPAAGEKLCLGPLIEIFSEALLSPKAKELHAAAPVLADTSH